MKLKPMILACYSRVAVWSENHDVTFCEYGVLNELISSCCLTISCSKDDPFLCLGEFHTLLYLPQRNQVVAKGSNSFGQLGVSSVNQSMNQFMVIKVPSKNHIIDVAAGDSHTVVATKNEVYVCGRGHMGQLGIMLEGNSTKGKMKKLQRKTLVPMFKYDKAVEISAVWAGGDCTFVQTKKELYACGNNFYGQLGVAQKDGIIPLVKAVKIDGKSIKAGDCLDIAFGPSHTILHTTNGIYACGKNTCGQLGTGNVVSSNKFIRIIPNEKKVIRIIPNEKKVIRIAAGAYFTVVLTEDNKVYVCGKNNFSPLLQGKIFTTLTKINLKEPGNNKIAKVFDIAAAAHRIFYLYDKAGKYHFVGTFKHADSFSPANMNRQWRPSTDAEKRKNLEKIMRRLKN